MAHKQRKRKRQQITGGKFRSHATGKLIPKGKSPKWCWCALFLHNINANSAEMLTDKKILQVMSKAFPELANGSKNFWMISCCILALILMF